MADEPAIEGALPNLQIPRTTGEHRPEVYPIGDWGRFWFALDLSDTWTPHQHPDFQGAIILQGEGELTLPAGPTSGPKIEGDCVLLFPAGVPHGVRLRRSRFIAAFNIAPGKAHELVSQEITTVSVRRLADYLVHRHIVSDICRDLRRERLAGPAGSQMHITFLGGLLATSLLLAHRRPPVRGELRLPPETERKLMEHIGKDFRADLSTESLAKLVGIAPDHFRRRFVETTGLTPDEYVLRARLNHARALLGAGGLNVSQVLELCGFHDHSFFTRRFRLQFGKPPRYYLRTEALERNSRL
jgi:AraC-like DNA-binding protein